ncbi:MAG: LemA family protein [Bacteroidetes bacterium]|nr:MAG: LemA family protein [Bacteroidota bacterium]
MKKSWIIIAIIVAIPLFGFMWANGVYNKMLRYDETTSEAWGYVQSAYQRRADLVPQLVATVDMAAENEKEILMGVTQARAGIVEYNNNLGELKEGINNAKNPEQMNMYGKKINTAINLAFEAYPNIRSTDGFMKLQDELSGTENRIKIERDRYTSAVKEYNIYRKGIMRNMALSILGKADEFEAKEGFKTLTEGADKAVDVREEFKK